MKVQMPKTGSRLRRSRGRRQDILDSAIRLLAASGSRAVTHHAVAEETGFLPSSVRYHFGTQSELLHAAVLDRLHTWQAEMSEGLESAVPTGLDLPSIVRRYVEGRSSSDASLYLAAYGTACRDDELRAAADAALWQCELLVARWLSRAGFPAPDELARSVLSLLLGAALRRASRPTTDADESAALTHALSRLLAGHMTERSRRTT